MIIIIKFVLNTTPKPSFPVYVYNNNIYFHIH